MMYAMDRPYDSGYHNNSQSLLFIQLCSLKLNTPDQIGYTNNVDFQQNKSLFKSIPGIN